MALPESLAQAAADLRDGRTTAVTMTEASLHAIERRGPQTHAFIHVDAAAARQAAAAADADLARGIDHGPLHGLPISLKDLVDVAGQRTSAASRVTEDHVAAGDAAIVSRLKAAGAILIGKTNLHEFALGTTSADSAFGPVLNPRDLTRSAGGSSGGSAVAVATGMGLASIGTDTGGSIRIPAAACGIVGLKPSLTDVPTAGVTPLSVTLDHVGPLTRTVRDAAWLWSILSGQPWHSLTPKAAGTIRLTVLGGYFEAPLDPDVREAFTRALGRLRAAGVTIEEAELAGTGTITETYVNLVLPEGAHVHSRWLDERADRYTPAVRDRLRAGREIPAVAYLAARQQRRALREIVDQALAHCDALVLPTLPIVAPESGATDVTIEGVTVPVRAAMLKHTQLFNITGHPAISLPLPTPGLPVGLQLVGRRQATPALLDVAATCEDLTWR